MYPPVFRHLADSQILAVAVCVHTRCSNLCMFFSPRGLEILPVKASRIELTCESRGLISESVPAHLSCALG